MASPEENAASPSGTSCIKPHISCHAPLKPNYLEYDKRIVPWASLDFRYKAPPQSLSRPLPRTKKKPSKHKKESDKSSTTVSKQSKSEPDIPNSIPTTMIDDSITSDPDHSGSHISVLPQYCLLGVFSYLSVGDLLRAGLVCKAWQQLSSDKSVWKSVSLEDSHILDWARAAKVFQTHGTIALDFFNNIINEDAIDTYTNGIYYTIKKIPHLQYLRFGHATTNLICKVTQHLLDLRVLQICRLEEQFSGDDYVTFDIGKLSKLTQLRELKIRSVNSLMQPHMSFSGGLASLVSLQHLQKLSITSLDENRICPLDYEFLNRLPELVELELGDCGNWRSEAYKILGKLTRLRGLRLENGGCWCNDDSSSDMQYPYPCTCNISETLGKLKELEKLELIMYAMPSDINPALKSLLKLCTLTFWPMVSLRGHILGPCAMGYEASLIQTNSGKCKALGKLHNLRHLTWGVPIITFDSPSKEYPYNVTTEIAVKSREVLQLSEMLGEQFPETAVNILIVPVVMNKELYQGPYSDSSDDCRGSTDSEDSDSDARYIAHWLP